VLSLQPTLRLAKAIRHSETSVKVIFMTSENSTKSSWAKRKAAVIAAAIALGSTAIIWLIEFNYSGGFPVGIPWGVFSFLAVASFVALTAFHSAVIRFKSNKWLAILLLVFSALALSAWLTLFLDQLPCFLGGRGC